MILPIIDMPQSPPSQTKVCMGVDLGGVLVAKAPSRMLRNIRTPADVAPMLAAGAREWSEECVAKCGPEHVFIISYVGSPRLRDGLARYLLGVGGLMGATGAPHRNLVLYRHPSAQSTSLHCE